MRMILLAAIITGASPAAALCRDDLLTVIDWNAELIDPAPALRFSLDVTVRYEGDRPIRMIDGSIGFDDVLGNRIGRMGMDPDTAMQPGDEHTFTGQWGRNTFERMLDMQPDDVVASTCIDGMVYADGEVVKFP